MSLSILRAIATAAIFACVLFFGATKADAMAEFCPARVTGVQSSGGPDVPSATYSYVLDAKTARTVNDAAIVADTDHGWYRWNVANVPLRMTSLTGSHPSPGGGSVAYTLNIARSDRQQVEFPETLYVRHAWITSARSDDESVMGWGKRGEYACEVPTFPNRGLNAAELARPQARKAPPVPQPSGTASALPPAADGAARAVPTSMPFDSIDCATPFREVRVTEAVSPDLPSVAAGLPAVTSVIVDIASDERGHLLDASVFSSSGYPALDRAGLRAARMSSYSGAVSYCQNVQGEYLFTASFLPR